MAMEMDGNLFSTVKSGQTLTINPKLLEKMAASKDGMVSMDDAEFKTILEAIKEDKAGKSDKKEQTIVGANLDLKI